MWVVPTVAGGVGTLRYVDSGCLALQNYADIAPASYEHHSIEEPAIL